MRGLRGSFSFLGCLFGLGSFREALLAPLRLLVCGMDLWVDNSRDLNLCVWGRVSRLPEEEVRELIDVDGATAIEIASIKDLTELGIGGGVRGKLALFADCGSKLVVLDIAAAVPVDLGEKSLDVDAFFRVGCRTELLLQCLGVCVHWG